MKLDYRCLVQPKRVAFWITIMKLWARTVLSYCYVHYFSAMGAGGGGDARHLPLPRDLENKTEKLTITKSNVIKTTT
jgi:hypothetical protein